MDAILLVGGFGTRLMPLTKHRPKPLMPLANIPFTERTIAWLRDAGVDHVILSLHYNTQQFIDHFARKDLGVNISFAIEDHPLGTGGAIRNCLPFMRSERSLVVNGDIFTNLDLHAMINSHRRANALASIALKTVNDPSRFGVIETNDDGSIISFTEKPMLDQIRSNEINAGIYLLERKAFSHFTETVSSVERDIFPSMLRKGMPLFGFRSRPYWTDLGTPKDYLQAHRDILSAKIAVPMPGIEIRPSIWVGEKTVIAKDAVLRAPLLLGDRVTIESGAAVGPNVVLGNEVLIGGKAQIKDSVLWNQVEVLNSSMISETIAGQNSYLAGVINGGLCEDFGQIDQCNPVPPDLIPPVTRRQHPAISTAY